MSQIIHITNRDNHFNRPERALNAALEYEPSRNLSHIYFIQQGTTGPIKIGISNNPYQRLANLQTANPYKLRLLFFYKIHPVKVHKVEERVHKLFQDDHIEGEWFFPSANLVNFICSEIQSQKERKTDILDINRGSLLQGLIASVLDQIPMDLIYEAKYLA